MTLRLPAVGGDAPFVLEGVRLPGTPGPVDIEVAEGVIAAIRCSAAAAPVRHIVLPALVDLHTHLREPGNEAAETIATGTRAAAAGGYGAVFAMANTDPVTDTVARVEELRRRAASASVRVHPVSAATVGLAGSELVDVRGMRAAGVTVFSDDGHCVDDDGLVFELLTTLATTGGVFAQHAQSPAIVGEGVINEPVADRIGCAGWPPAGEEAIVARDIAIARATGGRLHVCHVSTARTVDLIRWAKSVGAPVSAEVTPHHLMLTDLDAVHRGTALKVNPPLRSADDVRAVRQGLRDGTIDVVGTDHAPHPAAAKDRPWGSASFGMTGIETALAVVAGVFTDDGGTVDWAGVARVMSTRPAELGGIAAASGHPIGVGAPASLCIVEEGGPWLVDAATQYSKSRNAAFEGYFLGHRVVFTALEGRVTHSV